MEKPFSQACENNKNPILEVLKKLQVTGDVLEIGHGTGQHASYFSKHLPVKWFPADRKENNWMMESNGNNLHSPIAFEVGHLALKKQVDQSFDTVFTANTLHIMSEKLALKFCREVSDIIKGQGLLVIYGPFKFEGKFTSESNQEFDNHLKSKDPLMGIRDFEKIKSGLNDFIHLETIAMPANNFILCFKKK
ncbi:MAG: methylase [Halobacteriovoraceae bacterium]|nr:methylase [Halobacteriovoraceae bacterium]|tara:strand:- start:5163 stop:5738 length:576 start_codon:yes stop_codon:yes gene_type:complete